jgi:hypothetical protein
MIKAIDYDELTESQQKLYREVIAIRQRNADRIAKIEETGMMMDLTTARLEHTLSTLIHFGILTVDQVLEMNKDWELELKKQSREILARVEEAIRLRKAEAARPKLIIPGR